MRRVRTVVFTKGMLTCDQTVYERTVTAPYVVGSFIEENDSMDLKVAKRLMGVPYPLKVFLDGKEVPLAKDWVETEERVLSFGGICE